MPCSVWVQALRRFPIESEVDEDILVQVQALRRFPTEFMVDEDVGKHPKNLSHTAILLSRIC